MKNIELLIQKALKNERKMQGRDQKCDCPTPTDLYHYTVRKLNQKEKYKIEKHISECYFCLEQIVFKNDLTNRKERKMKKTDNIKLLIHKNKWLIGCITLFSLSFIYHKFFFQFIAASLITGIKWAIDNKKSDTFITVLGNEKTESKYLTKRR